MASALTRLFRACLPAAFDRYDESRARRTRQDFGRLGRLLSWSRGPDGAWRARLSCPELPRTIERSGKTRGESIDRADRVLRRILALRGTLRTPAGREARPDGDE